MTDESDAATGGSMDGDDATAGDLDETVAQFLRDVDAAHDDYDRGYVDADATLSVVMTHVEELRAAREQRE
ncbi:hypothetical protein [Halobellus rarus]|uniref:Uncharacterized protein n=1 Tax=Halobellus rarus TaxID=1126237 RepID=A0ABD6CLW1_9EURY|nr:hypothetical protein [Halobellus rarus]